MSSPLEDWLDESIPDEVLFDESWSPRLLPEPDNLLNRNFGYSDMTEHIDDDYEEDYDS